MEKKLLKCLNGEIVHPMPIWMMRQAGRHLPEYRAIRQTAKNFLDMCYAPDLAAEVTLQPIRRYGMDGAILFADILLVLDAMGLDVQFIPGTGPVIEQITTDKPVPDYSGQNALEHLSPVFETVRRVRRDLPDSTTLIGFAGSPWTVALYAIEGRGKTDKALAKNWAYSYPEALDAILDAIIKITVEYLIGQVDAGADALMLFDSWAGELPRDVFEQIVVNPTEKLVSKLRGRRVDVPIIGFPKGAGQHLKLYTDRVGVNGIGLGTDTNPEWVAANIDNSIVTQGHLDPLVLRAGGASLDRAVDDILYAYQNRPHIFNLGHGVTPDIPIDHVHRVIERVRNFQYG